VIDQVDGPHALGVRWVGITGPLFHTSPGKLVLASLSEQEVDAVLRGPVPATTPHALTDATAIRAQLDEVRRRGIALSIEDHE
jgi:DNA-binding IclR family transcriptional regulator